MVDLKGRDFLKLLDYTPEEITYLLDLAADLKDKKKKGILTDKLRGKNVALITKPYRQFSHSRKKPSSMPGSRTSWAATAGSWAIRLPDSSTHTLPSGSPARTGAVTDSGNSASKLN